MQCSGIKKLSGTIWNEPIMQIVFILMVKFSFNTIINDVYYNKDILAYIKDFLCK